MHVGELNRDLCVALGVKADDLKSVCRVVLTIEPMELPKVKVTRYVKTADGLQTAVEVLNLRPGGAEHGSVELKSEESQPFLRCLGDVQRLEMKEGDIVVFTAPGLIDDATAERLKSTFERQFPGRKAMILGDGLHVSGVLDQQAKMDTPESISANMARGLRIAEKRQG